MAAVTVTSQPVRNPTGLRATFGTINATAVTYSTGIAITAAQFGAGSNGIPNRFPDFVLVEAAPAIDDADADFVVVSKWNSSTNKVQFYGDKATDESGLTEIDETYPASGTANIKFLALWLEPESAGTTTA